MADFDPDSFLADSSDGFDPDAFVADAPAEQEPPADQGPPMDAAPMGAQAFGGGASDGTLATPTPQGRQKALLDRIRAAGLGLGRGVLGGVGDNINGVVEGITDKAAAKLGYQQDKPFADSYRSGRDYSRKIGDEAQAEFPTEFGGGNLIGGVASGVLGATILPGGLAAKGMQAVKQGAILGGLTGLGNSRADLTKGEIGGAALDTAGSAALGAGTSYLAPKIMSAAKNPIAQAKVALGEAAQWPQKLYEKGAEIVGRSGIAQKASSAAGDVAGNLASAEVKGLRQVIENAEMGSALASSLRASTEKLGGAGNKLVSAMTPEEKSQVAQAMTELLHTRGLKDVTPEFVAQNMDNLAAGAGLELENLTGNNFLRMANKRDPKWWVNAGEGVRKFWGSKLLAGEQIDPRLAQQYGLNREVADSMGKGEVDRMGRPFVEGGQPGVYQNSVSSINGKLDPRAAALDRIKSRAQARQASSPDNIKTNPVLRRPTPEEMAAQASGAKPSGGMTDEALGGYASDVRDHRVAQGYNPDAPGKTFDELFPTLSPKAQAAAKAEQESGQLRDAASGRLRDIATGRNFLEQKALPAIGGVAGFMKGGIAGGALGAATGARGVRGLDIAGELGQNLATSGRDSIRQSVLKMASDPIKLKRLADLPGGVGNSARWVLQKAQDPAAFTARAYVLSLQPEFRKMLGNDDEQSRRAE